MSRTWKREPIRRERQWNEENDHDYITASRLKHVAAKAPLLSIVSSEVTDEMESGDLTWTRRAGHA